MAPWVDGRLLATVGPYPNAGGLVPFKGGKNTWATVKKKEKRVSTLLLLCVLLLFRVASPADTHVRNITSNPDRVWGDGGGQRRRDSSSSSSSFEYHKKKKKKKRGNSERERNSTDWWNIFVILLRYSPRLPTQTVYIVDFFFFFFKIIFSFFSFSFWDRNFFFPSFSIYLFSYVLLCKFWFRIGKHDL